MNTMDYAGYLSPKVEIRSLGGSRGKAAFARQAIARDELIAVWGGRILSLPALHGLTPEQRSHTIQIEDGLFLASLRPDEPSDFINHSCSPNAGIRGQVVLVAMRPIAAGEEVTFDYAMADSTPYDEFDCACGAQTCRGRVTAEDWRLPQLQQRYRGYFSAYLQRRIDDTQK